MYSNFILNQESKAARLSACWASVQPLHRALALAQLLSFLLAVMGTTSALLANQGIVMPTTQSLINYAALLATFGACFFYKHRLQLSNPLWAYFLLALMDVEANFLMTKAYQVRDIDIANLAAAAVVARESWPKK